MRKIVERLRERPEEERKTVAAGVALATVGILFIGWGFSFVQGLGNGSNVMAQKSRGAAQRALPGGQPMVNTAAVQTSVQATTSSDYFSQ